MSEDRFASVKEEVTKHLSKLNRYMDRSFGVGLLFGVFLTTAAFSGYLYWDSLDHRTNVPITVVTCDSCEYDKFKDATDRMFKTSYREVDYQSETGQELIQKHNLEYVPGFIFDAEQLEKAENFTSVKPTLVESGDYYVIPDAGVKVAQRLSKGISLNRSEGE